MMPDLKFYLALFLRRFPYFLIVCLAVTGLGVTLAYTLPPVYNAQARLLVESPQIPDELAASTVQVEAPELLRIIQQRILTRANLLEISRKFNIHANRPEMTADDIVLDMRARTQIGLPNVRDTTGVVTVSFSAPTARQSAEVTNELVTQVLQQNVELRTTAASQTLDFFEQEVERLNDELARQGALILDFKLKNKDALPESLEYRRTRQASLQERLAQVDRDLAGLRDRRTQLAELYERTGQAGAPMEPLTPEQARLQQLKQELAAGLVIYSPQKPPDQVAPGAGRGAGGHRQHPARRRHGAVRAADGLRPPDRRHRRPDQISGRAEGADRDRARHAGRDDRRHARQCHRARHAGARL